MVALPQRPSPEGQEQNIGEAQDGVPPLLPDTCLDKTTQTIAALTYEPSEELLTLLADADNVTSADVLTLLGMQYSNMEHTGFPPQDFFRGDEDLDQWKQALAWWPADEKLPGQYAAPSLFQLCYAYQDDSMGATFADRLLAKGVAVGAWLEAQGRDSADPNRTETKEARRLRLAAKRQARFRATGKAQDTEHDLKVAAARAAWKKGVADRKDADVKWAAHVAGLKAQWEKLRDEVLEGDNGSE